MKFTLPTLTSSQQVISAQFSANGNSASGSANVRIHQVNNSWEPSNLTSNSSYNSAIEDNTYVSNSTTTYNWDINNIAKKWYCSNVNTGLMLDTDAKIGYQTTTPPPANLVTLGSSIAVTI